jgi:DNA-directed RNA polymerase specialized sigma subunit
VIAPALPRGQDVPLSLARAASDYHRAAERLEERRQVLYEAIRDAYADGRTLRAIAEETGLTFARIHQIVQNR